MLNNSIAAFCAPIPPVTNSYESIATYTVGSGGVASFDFTSIPSTYKHLQIRAIAKTTNGSNGSNLFMKINSDAGNNYSWHQLYGDGGSAGASGIASLNPVIFQSMAGSTASLVGAVVMDILDYSNTSKYKTVRSLGGYDANGSGVISMRTSVWQNTAAITTLTFSVDGWNYGQYSSFALYGIKG